jgi:hypothetical protein
MTSHQHDHEVVDAMCRVLAHPRRRYALRRLCDSEGPMTLTDLAGDVAAHETDEPITEIHPEEVQRVHLSLYHIHIPKLVDEQFVRYDRERRLVSLSDHGRQFEQHQELLTIG